MANRACTLESVVMAPDFWRDKRVFITGHTGFKGAWLTLWLRHLQAKVYGYALAAPTQPNLFEIAGVATELEQDTRADILDLDTLCAAMEAAQPQIVLHLAAQTLVREGYYNPVDTYATNIMGTVHVLEAMRKISTIRAAVIVTTDKCYENQEWIYPYREIDQLGGYDPYSSSKACTEIVVAAYRKSFFNSNENMPTAIATVRAGNVIGGGDWAADRLVPDFMRTLDQGTTLQIRSPDAIRPWQHVLEPLSGYLRLVECLYSKGSVYAEAWNFGPAEENARSVRWIIEKLTDAFPNSAWAYDQSQQLHEAQYLKLDSSKARARLDWRPRWNLDTALAKTIEWHAALQECKDMRSVSLAQIAEYTASNPLI